MKREGRPCIANQTVSQHTATFSSLGPWVNNVAFHGSQV